MPDVDEEQAVTRWHAAATVWFLLVMVINSLLIGWGGQDWPHWQYVLASFAFVQGIGAIGVLAIVRVAVPRDRRRQALCLPPLSWGAVRRGVGLGLLITPVVWVVSLATILVWRLMGWPLFENPMIQWLYRDSWTTVAAIAGVAVFGAPLAEELCFRVAFYGAVRHHRSAAAAMVLTSLVFAGCHLIPEQVPGLFALALVLQWAVNRSGDLWEAIVLHATFNGLMIGLAIGSRFLPEALPVTPG